MKGHMIATVVWLGLIGAGYAAFEYMGQRREAVQGCDGGAAPAEIVVPASRDGHFYLDGAVNGAPVRFLVDTGASYVTINSADAGAAGVKGGAPAMFETAAGRIEGRIVRSQRVSAACLSVGDLAVAVNPELGDVALLGQNFLRQFEVLQTRQELRLRAR